MATRLKERPTYDEDFYAWTQDQARRLRVQDRLRRNEPLDWKLLAEEVEDLGKSELHACQSLTVQIIAHLLKLQFSGTVEPRAGWEREITAFRLDLERKLTLSIRCKIENDLKRHHTDAKRLLLPEFRRYEPTRLALLPADCPYSFAQILGADDWFPTPHSPVGQD